MVSLGILFFTINGLLCFLQDGLPAIHKAIISKKHAIINYLLRNSANPFICDKVSISFETTLYSIFQERFDTLHDEFSLE